MSDIRIALRRLRKNPGFTLVVALTLALGIGANATVFSIVDGLLLRPLPLDDLDRIATLTVTAPSRTTFRIGATPADFLDWKARSRTLEALSAYDSWAVNLQGGAEPERLQGALVSVEFFTALGVQPAIGRGFRPDEGGRGRHLVTMLGHGFWMSQYGGDPAIVGQTLILNAEAYTVVGVAPEEFSFPTGTDVWAPLVLDGDLAASRDTHSFQVLARLAPGATYDDAQAELDVNAARLEEQYPETNAGEGVRVMTLAEGIRDEGDAVVYVLQATAVFVLLIACVNIANLLLARGTTRRVELAVRVAHGASRWRVVRLLLAEGVALSLLGGAFALGFAWIGIDLIRSNMPADIARVVTGFSEIDIDGRLVFWTLVTAATSGLLFSIAPAWRASRPNVNDTLKEGGRSPGAEGGRSRLRSALIVTELALAVALLVAAGLTIRGSLALLLGDHGYEPERVLTAQLRLPDARYRTDDQRRQFWDDLLGRVQSLPLVEQVASISHLPSSNSGASQLFLIEGRPQPPDGQWPLASSRVSSPGYFATLQIPLHRGRDFTARDDEDAPPVAIISQLMAGRFWPDEDPIGQRLRFSAPGTDDPWIEVVGVSGDVVHQWFSERGEPTVYRPYDQAPRSSMMMAVQAAGDPAALASAVRGAVSAVDPEQPLFRVITLQELMRQGMIGLTYIVSLMMVFGAIALLLAAIGVYGVMAYSVSQRTHEFGVRIALGAGPSEIVGLVLRRLAALSAVGLAVGLVAAYALSNVLVSVLEGIVGMDAATFVGVAAFLALVALAAGLLPARRALRVDPVIALRGE